MARRIKIIRRNEEKRKIKEKTEKIRNVIKRMEKSVGIQKNLRNPEAKRRNNKRIKERR